MGQLVMKISAIIIAKNEELNIGRCLLSLQKTADEIFVLIDSSTTDKTEDIVKTFPGVKYKVSAWEGYAQSKINAVAECSNDWIFWIDADEELSDELIEEFNQFKKKSPLYLSYSFPRKASFLGRWILHCGWYPGRVVRLFNKTEITFSSSKVHEHLVLKGTTGEFKSNILHYTDPDLKHYFDKYNIYTSLAANELSDKGKKFKLSDIIIRPFYMFIKMYFIKAGFLDGIQGFILSINSSSYVFTKYCKLWELNRKK